MCGEDTCLFEGRMHACVRGKRVRVRGGHESYREGRRGFMCL